MQRREPFLVQWVPYTPTSKLQAFKDVDMLSIKVRCEWNCSLSSISSRWRSFSSIISHLLRLLQAVALLACSLGADLGMPAVVQFSPVQSLSRARLSVTPWTAARQASLSITSSRSLLKLRSIESVMPSSHLSLCHPLLLFNLYQHQVFSNESVLCIRWPRFWSFSFTISPSNEYSGLISFRMDWLDLLAVQGIVLYYCTFQSTLF